MENNSLKKVTEEALKYESIGFSVMPLGSITKNAKGGKEIQYPSNGWKQYQTIRATPEEIKSWNYKNLGIVTGKISNLLVLDLDSYKDGYDHELEKSLMLSPTPIVQTANGGRQCYFRWPNGLTIKNDVCIGHKGSGIDIRAEGGMVIAPPSITSYGEYTWILDPLENALAEVPPKLLEFLTQESTKDIKNKKELSDLVGLKDGEGRNNALASAIGKLLLTTNSNDWDKEVLPVAQVFNNTHTPPLDQEELLAIYNSITNKERERLSKLSNQKESVTDVNFAPAMTHAELIAREFPPARYTIEPFFEQGTMNMLSAPPNTWKSWLFFYFALHIARGTLVFDKFTTDKSGVIIVNEEDSARLVQDRLKNLQITEPGLQIYYRIAQGAKMTKIFVQNLIREAKEKNVGVIMFDSLRAVHEADENDSTAMQGVMDLFKMIARENITVLFTHHHRKKQGFAKNDDADATRGSSAINAAISGHISLEEAQNEDGTYLIVRHLKSKVGEKLEPFDIAIRKHEGTVSFHYVGDHKAKEKALTETKKRILAELQERQELMGRKDFIHFKIGGTSTVKDATNDLEKAGEIKSITRKEAEATGKDIFNKDGKPNEKLYYIEKEVTLDIFNGLE
jgi:RecA-family ATPase